MYSVQDTLAGGLPHSEIHGSKLVRSSPWLIAAYDVLHRLSAPRHPPNALKTLDRSHYRCPLRLGGKAESFRKDQLLRGSFDRRRLSLRIFRQAAEAAFEQNLLFTMSDNTCTERRKRFGTNCCFQSGRSACRRVITRQAGGARRDRTDDLLLAKQALSQLSYGPGSRSSWLPGRSSRRAKAGGPG